MKSSIRNPIHRPALTAIRNQYKSLSPAQVHQFEQDGFLAPLPVLRPDEAAGFRLALEEMEARLGEPLRYAAWPHLFFRWAYDLATHPAVLDVVEDLLGPDILIHATLILCKHPHDPAGVTWHQDGTHSGASSTPWLSAWIALSESTSENGCMRAIPGSHKQGARPHVFLQSPGSLVRNVAQVQAEIDQTQARDLALKPGEMSLHHGHVIHGSEPSQSDAKRIGFIIRFITAQFETDSPVIRVRGQADCSHLNLTPGPPTGSLDEGIAAWKAFLEQRSQSHTR
jgi:hypothetical protein